MLSSREVQSVADRMAEARIPPDADGRYWVKAGTWSDYQCWLALGGLAGGRGAVLQRLVAPSTVTLLGYWHEEARELEWIRSLVERGTVARDLARDFRDKALADGGA